MVPLLAAAGPMAELVKGVLDRVLPVKMSEAERAQVELELMKVDWQVVLSQLAVNAEEAKHESVFVSGWRSFIGWVCGSALAWNFVAGPLLTFALTAAGSSAPPLPVLDATTLMPVLLGMLGLGGLRTFEKVQGANKRR